MIAITGASGKLGSLTIRILKNHVDPEEIVAVARSPEECTDLNEYGIWVRGGDYNSKESMIDALQNVDKLLQISTTATGKKGIQQERNVVNAAKYCGVKRIIYTSSLHACRESRFLATQQASATESFIKQSGFVYSFFRNSLYMELIPNLVGNASETGVIRYPAGDGKVSFVNRKDIAKALASELLNRHEENRIYEITGSCSYSFHDLAELLAQKTGKNMLYENITPAEYKELLNEQSVPTDTVDLLTSLARAIRANEFSHYCRTLQDLLNEKPVSLETYLQSI
ncbi:MAG: SDR family oxidoreductase [Balneolaceae bacterium]|nr:MAG: SDR family oxidoreductase [Balneolaceae bacterium]